MNIIIKRLKKRPNKRFNSELNLLLVVCMLTVLYFASCKSQKGIINIVKTEPTSCDTTKTELNFDPNSTEYGWLNSNEDKCIRINEFLKMFDYSEDCREYMKLFVQAKINDDEYKLERFIELYCLINQNPDALIDGSLNNDKGN